MSGCGRTTTLHASRHRSDALLGFDCTANATYCLTPVLGDVTYFILYNFSSDDREMNCLHEN